MLKRKPFMPSLVLALVVSCWGLQVNAQSDAHDHDASHALSLNNGQQWETDAALRHGMLEIRAAVTMLTPAFESGQLNQTQAHQLSEAVRGSVNTMIEQCELAPEADANLHSILAKLL